MTGHASRAAFVRRLESTGVEGQGRAASPPQGTQRLPAGRRTSTADTSAELSLWARAVAKLMDFAGARNGVVAMETALTLTALVVICSGLMTAAYTLYSGDRMDRAARAAARAIALLTPGSAVTLYDTACGAIRRELDLADNFTCNSVWTISIETDLTPSALVASLGDDNNATVPGSGDGGDAGELILVRVGVGQGLARREPTA